MRGEETGAISRLVSLRLGLGVKEPCAVYASYASRVGWRTVRGGRRSLMKFSQELNELLSAVKCVMYVSVRVGECFADILNIIA